MSKDEDPDFKKLNDLRQHQTWKMGQFYENGTFWFTPEASDGAPVLLISKKDGGIQQKYIDISKPKKKDDYVTGNYEVDKKKKIFKFKDIKGKHGLSDSDLGKALSAIGGKAVELYFWNGKELETGIAMSNVNIEVLSESRMKATIDEQMKDDVAAWNGAIAKCGTPGLDDVLKGIFTVLVNGGLIYREDNKGKWKPWAGIDLPVACVLSHGGRVMLQLPKGKAAGEFWEWLVVKKFQGLTRPFATHGIEVQKEEDTGFGKKYLHETKGKVTALKELLKSGSTHLGINVALFGQGNLNPFSQKLVSANGEHGHLYIYYQVSTDSTHGGVLIGCEGSEAGKADQFGHMHDAKAISSDISPTGGLKWRHNKIGPGSKGDANDTLFVDLSDEKRLEKLMNAKLITDTGAWAKKPG